MNISKTENRDLYASLYENKDNYLTLTEKINAFEKDMKSKHNIQYAVLLFGNKIVVNDEIKEKFIRFIKDEVI